MSSARWLCGLLAAATLIACTAYSPAARRDSADALAGAAGWQPLRIATTDFVLAGYAPPARAAADLLSIYIEGDGLAYFDRAQVSPDPTPRDPVALRLALLHPQGTAVYLARPCQYVQGADARGCATTWWTQQRFAPAVVAATDQAISQLKQRFSARRLQLIGYSGGGAIAALVAARRDDVARLVTVAGNLDIAEWTARHRVPPLRGSLNPADAWQRLAGLPQLHLAGARDRITGPASAQAYASRFPAPARPRVRVIEEFDHGCCWAARWPQLMTGE